MLAGDVFFDTNILLYAHQTENTYKVERAAQWLEQATLFSSGRTNLQVLNEVSNVLLKKRQDFSAETVWQIVDDFAYLGASPLDWQDVATARQLRISTRYSWWDCLLLASASQLGCSHFLSEDLQDGHEIGELTIINPFLHAPEELFGPTED